MFLAKLSFHNLVIQTPVEVDPKQLATSLPPVPPLCDHTTCGGCWHGYPQSRFPNWTPSQVKKSKIHKAITEYRRDVDCICHHVDVNHHGLFTDAAKIVAAYGDEGATWEQFVHAVVCQGG